MTMTNDWKVNILHQSLFSVFFPVSHYMILLSLMSAVFGSLGPKNPTILFLSIVKYPEIGYFNRNLTPFHLAPLHKPLDEN